MKNGMEVDEYGTRRWYLNKELHRVHWPAVEWADGTKIWYLNDELHRVDGPAIEWGNGSKWWYLHGKELVHPEEFLTMEEWLLHLNNNEEYSYRWINDIKDLIGFINNPSPRQKRLHQMRWVL